MIFEFLGLSLSIVLGEYAEGTLAVQAIDRDGMPFATLSVNMSLPMPDGAFYLKDWSENAQVAEAFIASGLIVPAPDVPDASNGFVSAKAYRLVA